MNRHGKISKGLNLDAIEEMFNDDMNSSTKPDAKGIIEEIKKIGTASEGSAKKVDELRKAMEQTFNKKGSIESKVKSWYKPIDDVRQALLNTIKDFGDKDFEIGDLSIKENKDAKQMVYNLSMAYQALGGSFDDLGEKGAKLRTLFDNLSSDGALLKKLGLQFSFDQLKEAFEELSQAEKYLDLSSVVNNIGKKVNDLIGQTTEQVKKTVKKAKAEVKLEVLTEPVISLDDIIDLSKGDDAVNEVKKYIDKIKDAIKKELTKLTKNTLDISDIVNIKNIDNLNTKNAEDIYKRLTLAISSYGNDFKVKIGGKELGELIELHLRDALNKLNTSFTNRLGKDEGFSYNNLADNFRETSEVLDGLVERLLKANDLLAQVKLKRSSFVTETDKGPKKVKQKDEETIRQNFIEKSVKNRDYNTTKELAQKDAEAYYQAFKKAIESKDMSFLYKAIFEKGLDVNTKNARKSLLAQLLGMSYKTNDDIKSIMRGIGPEEYDTYVGNLERKETAEKKLTAREINIAKYKKELKNIIHKRGSSKNLDDSPMAEGTTIPEIADQIMKEITDAEDSVEEAIKHFRETVEKVTGKTLKYGDGALKTGQWLTEVEHETLRQKKREEEERRKARDEQAKEAQKEKKERKNDKDKSNADLNNGDLGREKRETDAREEAVEAKEEELDSREEQVVVNEEKAEKKEERAERAEERAERAELRAEKAKDKAEKAKADAKKAKADAEKADNKKEEEKEEEEEEEDTSQNINTKINKVNVKKKKKTKIITRKRPDGALETKSEEESSEGGTSGDGGTSLIASGLGTVAGQARDATSAVNGLTNALDEAGKKAGEIHVESGTELASEDVGELDEQLEEQAKAVDVITKAIEKYKLAVKDQKGGAMMADRYSTTIKKYEQELSKSTELTNAFSEAIDRITVPKSFNDLTTILSKFQRNKINAEQAVSEMSKVSSTSNVEQKQPEKKASPIEEVEKGYKRINDVFEELKSKAKEKDALGMDEILNTIKDLNGQLDELKKKLDAILPKEGDEIMNGLISGNKTRIQGLETNIKMYEKTLDSDSNRNIVRAEVMEEVADEQSVDKVSALQKKLEILANLELIISKKSINPSDIYENSDETEASITKIIKLLQSLSEEEMNLLNIDSDKFGDTIDLTASKFEKLMEGISNPDTASKVKTELDKQFKDALKNFADYLHDTLGLLDLVKEEAKELENVPKPESKPKSSEGTSTGKPSSESKPEEPKPESKPQPEPETKSKGESRAGTTEASTTREETEEQRKLNEEKSEEPNNTQLIQEETLSREKLIEKINELVRRLEQLRVLREALEKADKNAGIYANKDEDDNIDPDWLYKLAQKHWDEKKKIGAAAYYGRYREEFIKQNGEGYEPDIVGSKGTQEKNTKELLEIYARIIESDKQILALEKELEKNRKKLNSMPKPEPPKSEQKPESKPESDNTGGGEKVEQELTKIQQLQKAIEETKAKLKELFDEGNFFESDKEKTKLIELEKLLAKAKEEEAEATKKASQAKADDTNTTNNNTSAVNNNTSAVNANNNANNVSNKQNNDIHTKSKQERYDALDPVLKAQYPTIGKWDTKINSERTHYSERIDKYLSIPNPSLDFVNDATKQLQLIILYIELLNASQKTIDGFKAKYQEFLDKLSVKPNIKGLDELRKELEETGKTANEAYMEFNDSVRSRRGTSGGSSRASASSSPLPSSGNNGEASAPPAPPTTPASSTSSRSGLTASSGGETSLPSSSGNINAETSDLQIMENEIRNKIPEAISVKNKAFLDEKNLVTDLIGKEIAGLKHLEEEINTGVPKAVSEGRSSIDSATASPVVEQENELQQELSETADASRASGEAVGEAQDLARERVEKAKRSVEELVEAYLRLLDAYNQNENRSREGLIASIESEFSKDEARSLTRHFVRLIDNEDEQKQAHDRIETGGKKSRVAYLADRIEGTTTGTESTTEETTQNVERVTTEYTLLQETIAQVRAEVANLREEFQTSGNIQSIQLEYEAFRELIDILSVLVPYAIEQKNNAFEVEEEVVREAVNNEIDYINALIGRLSAIVTTVNFGGVELGDLAEVNRIFNAMNRLNPDNVYLFTHALEALLEELEFFMDMDMGLSNILTTLDSILLRAEALRNLNESLEELRQNITTIMQNADQIMDMGNANNPPAPPSRRDIDREQGLARLRQVQEQREAQEREEAERSAEAYRTYLDVINEITDAKNNYNKAQIDLIKEGASEAMTQIKLASANREVENSVTSARLALLELYKMSKQGRISMDDFNNALESFKLLRDSNGSAENTLRLQTEYYNELAEAVAQYAEIRKRMKEGNGESGDLAEVDRLEKKINDMTRITNNPFYDENMENQALEGMFRLDEELQAIQDRIDKVNAEKLEKALSKASTAFQKFYAEAKKYKDMLDSIMLGLSKENPIKLANQRQAMESARTNALTALGVSEINNDLTKFTDLDAVNTYNNAESLYNTYSQGTGLDNLTKDAQGVANLYTVLIQLAKKYVDVITKRDSGKTLTMSEKEYLDKVLPLYESVYDKARNLKDMLSDNDEHLATDLDNAIGSANYDNINNLMSEIQKVIDGFEVGKNSNLDQWIDKIQKEYEDLGKIINAIDWTGNDPVDVANRNDVLREVGNLGQKIATESKSDSFKNIGEDQKSNLSKRMTDWISKNTRATDAIAEIKRLQDELKNTDDKASFDNIKKQFGDITQGAMQAGEAGRSFGDKLMMSFGNLSRYLLSFASFYRIIGVLKQGITVVREMDSALVEMRKVSDETVTSLKQFQKESFGMAEKLGTTSKQLQDSTADWLRLGKSMEEAKEMAQLSTKLMNVSEFTDINDATQALVSATLAYKDVNPDDLVSKLNLVGNNFAIGTDQLALGLQSAAAVLVTQGNSLDEALALITSGNLLEQDVSKASAGIRMISLRIAG